MKMLTQAGNYAFLLLALSTISHANQYNSFSVFQPTVNTSANIYFKKNTLIVHATGEKPTNLTKISHEFIRKYPSKLYRVFDRNQDGTFEIAALTVVNSANNTFCYDTFQQTNKTGQYQKVASGTHCFVSPQRTQTNVAFQSP
ncbi:MAG: Unknown protein [uncultured Thiotrichaceae bacterium]|uniref:Uncharacterized protein n=1 Tax=uncultured Thiotrichaceae bacterium TaxID=298394 RepID=A0A6S6U3N5_9GAMM|nr:MAG: Unknown protein [uncultured Thiotrichaceae bacterium]